MSDIQPFDFRGEQVRTVLVEGEAWFVASDVTTVLGYSATSAMTRSMDEDEKGVQSLHTLGGSQEFTVINEPGLYSAILRSRVPDARAFKRWVTHEVLPEIRRTGAYGSQLPGSFAEALELAAAKQRQIEAAEAQLLEQAPKVEIYERFMDADGYYSVEAVAKIIGTGRNRLFRALREDGVLLASNLPAQRYMHHFKVTTSTWEDNYGREHVRHTTRVRATGLAWLAKRYAVTEEVDQ